jgi:hypothetical protein
MLKTMIGLGGALALSLSAPLSAAAPAAASPSTATAPNPAPENVQGNALNRRTAVFGGIALLAIIVAILLLSKKGTHAQPASP